MKTLVKTLHLNKGRESSLLRRHPWVFSGAIERMSGNADSGDTVRVVDAKGKLLGLAAYSPSSQIRARMWTFGDNEGPIDSAFLYGRLQRAVARRQALFNDPQRTGCRLHISLQ